MADRLRTTQAQSRILLGLVSNQTYDEKTSIPGLTCNDFDKLKKNRVANSTFLENIGYLNKNGLVELVPYKKLRTKRKRTFSKRKKYPYKITRLGRFALLKSIEPKEFRKIVSSGGFPSIPLIESHFEEMKMIANDSKTDIGKHFDKILYEILRRSVKQIKIASGYTQGIELSGKNIMEKITIDYGYGIPSISYEKLYSVLTKKEEKSNDEPRFPSAKSLEGDTIERLAFLFYFNLLLIGRTDNLISVLFDVPELDVNFHIIFYQNVFQYQF